MSDSTKKISILGYEVEQYRGGGGQNPVWHDLDISTLKDSVDKFGSGIFEVVSPLADSDKGFSVKEVELSLQISTEGKVGLLGSGVSAGAQASIKVKLVRSR